MKNAKKKRIFKAFTAVALIAAMFLSFSAFILPGDAELQKISEYNLVQASFPSADKRGFPSFRNAFDVSPISYAKLNAGSELTFDFRKLTVVNTVTLRELGSKCEKFSIYGADKNGDRKLLYSNDVIDSYLYCSFPDAEVTKLIFKVEKADGAVRLQDIAVYNRAKNEGEQRVHSYIVLRNGDTYFSNPENRANVEKMLDVSTDVIIIGANSWNEDGSISYPQETYDRELAAFREIDGDRGTRLWLCFFPPRLDSEDAMNAAAEKAVNEHFGDLSGNILAVCDRYDLDGIDIDWEYPRAPRYWRAFDKLLVSLKPLLAERGIGLSAALGPWGNIMSKEAKNALDFVNVMAYDWDKNSRGYHSEFYSCHYFSARYFMNHGYKKSQIVMGVPFYGNTCDGQGFSQANYSGAQVKDKGQNVFLIGGREYYFNGYNLIYSKTAFNYDNDFAGTMIYAANLDVSADSEFSLTKAVDEAVKSRNA